MEKDFPSEKSLRPVRTWLWIVCAAALLLNLALLWVNPLPGNDVAGRYAPMAEQFAGGHWRYAFHPRFGLLFPALSGALVWLTGLDGFRGCQMAALLLFTLAAPVWYGVFRRVWDERTALAGVVFYFLSSHLLRTVLEGLREPGKALGFALAVYGVIVIFQQPRRWAGYGALSVGGAILTLIRGDGALCALLLLGVGAALEIRRRRAWPWRSLAAALGLLALTAPQLGYNLYVLGYPVPECRHALLLKQWGMPPLKKPLTELP